MLLAIAVLLTVFVLSPPIGAAVVLLAAVFEVGEVAFWRRLLSSPSRQYRYRGAAGRERRGGGGVQPVGQSPRAGSLWNARAPQPMKVGDLGRVTAVDGLTLEIAPAQLTQGPKCSSARRFIWRK